MEASLFRDILYSIHLDSLLDSFDCRTPTDFEDYLIALKILLRQQEATYGQQLSQKALAFSQSLVTLQNHPQLYGFGAHESHRFHAITQHRILARMNNLNQVKGAEIQRYCDFKSLYLSEYPNEIIKYPSGWLRERGAKMPDKRSFTREELDTIIEKDKAFRQLEHIMSAADEHFTDRESHKNLERFYLFMQEEIIPIGVFVNLSDQNLKRCLELINPQDSTPTEYRPNERFMHPLSQKLLRDGCITSGQLNAMSNDDFNKITQRHVAKAMYKGLLNATQALALTPQQIKALQDPETIRLLKNQPELVARVIRLAEKQPSTSIHATIKNEMRLTRLVTSSLAWVFTYWLFANWFLACLAMTVLYFAADAIYLNVNGSPRKASFKTASAKKQASRGIISTAELIGQAQRDVPLSRMILQRKNTPQQLLAAESQGGARPSDTLKHSPSRQRSKSIFKSIRG